MQEFIKIFGGGVRYLLLNIVLPKKKEGVLI